LVLHAHLPYVRHPEYERFLEEHWLFEAITWCYLPLTIVLRDAARRGSPFRLTLSLSPTLLSQLVDPLLRGRFLDYLDRLIRLCEQEVVRRRQRREGRLARWYLQRVTALRGIYLDELGEDLVAAWVELHDGGLLELMTTAATHGYLPLLRTRPSAVRAQLRVGRDAFRRLTGVVPDGLWLPECGYYPGLEEEISDADYVYTVLETHGIQQARPAPPWDVYGPLVSGGVALFGRDPLSAEDAWGPDTGFPGHPVYREYHRDLGFEAEAGALDGFLPDGVRAAPTGIKYFRVTGGGGPKGLYDPNAAALQAAADARRFLGNRRRLIHRFPAASRPPLIVAPYDAELFGHWWFEGPTFLNALIGELEMSGDIEAVTLGQHLRRFGTVGPCQAAASSWGERGYNATWLRPETGWVHLALHQAAGELEELLRRFGPRQGDARELRLLRQASRALLLAQGSDWTFHMGRGGGAGYARAHVRGHLARFHFLADLLRRGTGPEAWAEALGQMDNLFPDLELGHFLDIEINKQ
jgi:1,4-alpha-glucan branching enzyme